MILNNQISLQFIFIFLAIIIFGICGANQFSYV